jgi:hypothetical protein
MALNIVQGPLPSDNTSVVPDTFLEAWINGTVITDLSAENFDTSENGISFVVSQTDAPASSTRTPGMFWYERGEGQLWVWDALDSPSELTLATDSARYHGGHDWIGLSRGRQMWVIANEDIPKGAVCYLKGSSLTEGILTTWSGSRNEFWEPDDPLRRGHSPMPARQYWWVTHQAPTESGTAWVTEFAVIALETGNSGALFRATEMGWTEILAHSGTTGSAALGYVSDSGLSESAFVTPGAIHTQSTNPGRMVFVTMTDSSATNPTDVWLRSAFKQHFPAWGIARERV